MAKQRSSSPVGRNASAGGSGHKVSAFASDRKARPTSSSRKAHPGTGGRKVQPASGCRQEPPTVSGRKASSAISDRKASPAAIDRKARPAASGHKARPAANSRKANPAFKVSSAASDRKAPCPIMRDCGGCEWLGLPYRKQLKRKHAAMVELYESLIGRFGWNVHVDDVLGMGPSREAGPVTAADSPLASPRAFRHKASTPFAPGSHGEVRCGFFARGTHTIVPCPVCPVEAPGARELLNEVARLASDLGIPAYDEDRRQGQLRYAVLRCGWRTNESMLTLVTRTREVPHLDALAQAIAREHPGIVTIAQNINPRVTNAILGGETRLLHGEPRMHDQLLDCTFEISPVSFYQVNPQQTEVLYQSAIDGMQLREGDTVLDTYCGSGTIGLAAAASTRANGAHVRLIGVERNVEGMRDAQRNAQANGLEGMSDFIARDATEYMREAAEQGLNVDVLIMDPPRVGSTPAFVEAATSLKPRRIVYISCNPVTHVRDLELFGEAGYRVDRLTPVDLFPHTTHTEMIATLTPATS